VGAEAAARAFLAGTASIVAKREGCLTLLLIAIKYLELRQGEALLELDANARHDSSDAYESVHVKKRVHSPLSMGLTAWRERKSAVK
jgi:hypothetical protein